MRFLEGGALAALAVASLLACSTAPPPPAMPLPGYDDLLAMAGDFHASGNDRAATELYRHAAAVEPSRKEPWQHIARIHLAAGRPGLALVAAEEVLHRDPADEFANEVYISSAMAIARDAMQRLLASGAVPGEEGLARARQLVAAMGLVYGYDELIREEFKVRCAQRAVQRYLDKRSEPCRRLPPTGQQEKAQRDPLEVLGGD